MTKRDMAWDIAHEIVERLSLKIEGDDLITLVEDILAVIETYGGMEI